MLRTADSDPLSPAHPPLSCTQHLYFSSWLGTIKCSWEGSSHPDRQVLKWARGREMAFAWLWELQPNSCLLVTQTECVAREALWWVPLNLLPLFWPSGIFLRKVLFSAHVLSVWHMSLRPLCKPGQKKKYHCFMWNGFRHVCADLDIYF